MRNKVIAALIWLMLAAPALAQERQPLTVDDLHRVADVSDPDFSADGKFIAYTVAAHNLKKDATVSDIWRVSWQDNATKQLTRTPDVSEWQPQYSNDGKTIFFLSDGGKKEETQVWVMAAKGGKARQVTHLPGGVSDYTLSPGGKQVAVIAEVGKTVGVEGTKPPIVINRFQFKEDGRDYLDDRRQQLFVVDVGSGKATQVTQGDFDHWLPAWSPDGRWISFVSKRRGDADRNIDFDVFIIAPEAGATPKRISNFDGTDVDPYWESPPAWSPDSKRLVWLQSGEDKWVYYTPWQLTVADIETGAVTDIARIDRCFFKPRWSADGRSIYALIEQDRDTWLARIDAASGTINYMTSGKRFAYDFALGADNRVAVLDSDPHMPFEISAVTDNGLRPLTTHNDWLKFRTLAEVRDINFTSDGVDIHGMLVLPVKYQPGKRYPAIVRLHGGPVYQFSHEFMADWLLYAQAGYAVVAVNPRGSSGRGFDFAKAIYADWGNVDVRDVKAAVDHVIEMGIADPDHLGVGGWSYGGILTDYVIAHDTRFKAAVSGAGSANALTMYGADQYTREYELELGAPWRNSDSYLRLSYPFLHADKIKTATLFQCAQSDFNVPCIGAEQMYQALRSEGVATELVIYPDENHGLTAPSYLEDRMRRNIAWYDRFLKAEN